MTDLENTVKLAVSPVDVQRARETASKKDHTNSHKPEVRTPVDQLLADLSEHKVEAWMASRHPLRYARYDGWQHDGTFDERTCEVKCRQTWRYDDDDHWLFLRENTDNEPSDIYIQVLAWGDLDGVEDPDEVSAEDIEYMEISGHIPRSEVETQMEQQDWASENPFVRYEYLHSMDSLETYANMIDSGVLPTAVEV